MERKQMVVLAIVNMLVLLVGFLSGLRKKGPAANQGMAGDQQANQACIE
jgi:hypothetical protein